MCLFISLSAMFLLYFRSKILFTMLLRTPLRCCRTARHPTLRNLSDCCESHFPIVYLVLQNQLIARRLSFADVLYNNALLSYGFKLGLLCIPIVC